MQRETVGRPMEVLLVEDSLMAARLTIGALKQGKIEHRMTWLTSGEEAQQFLCRQGKFVRAPQPDLVLLDLMLPGISGQELLSEIRQDDELKDIPVVIMTGTAEENVEESCRNLRVQGFLTKPINLDEFLDLVAQLKDYWKADMILPTARA
ncbi:Response regulator rcp1 [Maioricimonas rarisocia]|uniref:Response regulator rcp1 n=1 Tax=Maioricimonas rarisocia TaxID=2528026 RepID=A0A517Z5M7_9PLAN|nr:response regulator [Maioricimonas rarisocia]QDU37800.1 Response regulator rcp1 [Maioricimonas rarisocia]